MNRADPGSGALLAVAGYASTFLLAWLFLIVPYLPRGKSTILPFATGAVCVWILVLLAPVIALANWQQRALAMLLAIFPATVLAFSILARTGFHALAANGG